MPNTEQVWFAIGVCLIGGLLCAFALYQKKWVLAAVGFNIYVTGQCYAQLIK